MSNGLVTLVASGTTALTITRPGGHSLTDTITVSAPLTTPGAPTASNATAQTASSLTFPVTLNASGDLPSALAWRYSTDNATWTNGTDLTLTSPSLGQSLSKAVSVPSASTLYYVQFAEKNTAGTSSYCASVTGTTSAAGAAPTMQASDLVITDSTSAFAAATKTSDLMTSDGTGYFPNNNFVGTWRFVSNFDGSGENAVALDWAEWKHTTVTTGFSSSASPQTITVGDTTGWIHNNNLVIDPRGPNSEEIATGNWSIVDATHVSVLATKNHSAGEVVGCEEEHNPYVDKPFTSPVTLGAYYRFRWHAGKTTQDASGVGVVPAVGDNSTQSYFNDADISFSGDKRCLIERAGRVYTKFGYSYGASPQSIGVYDDTAALSHTSNVTTVDPDTLWGKDVDTVIYFEPAQAGDGTDVNDNTRQVVSDGVFKMWINGVQTHDYSGLPVGMGGVNSIQTPATFRTPKHPFTEYLVGLQAWVPTPVTTQAPSAPSVVLGTQYTDATGVIPSTSLNYTITDPGTSDAPYAVYAEVDENGTGSWVAQNLRTWRNGSGGSQTYLVSGLTPSKDYTGKIRFTFRNTTGDSATKTVVASGTTAAPPSVAHSALYAVSTPYAHAAPSFTHGSAALPLTDNVYSSGSGLAWKTLGSASANSGSNPYAQTTFGAASQSAGFFGAISMPLNAQTLPTGTYTLSYQIATNGGQPYQLAPVIYVWRPSTGAIVGYLIDSATGIGPVATTTLTGHVVGVTVTNAVTVEEGDVLVWEAWMVGTGSDFLYLDYDGHTAIVDGATGNTAPQMKVAFPAPITFES